MKAISNTIAIVILTTITLIIALTLATYIYTIFIPIQEKSLETLIKGDSYITKSNESYEIYLHLYSNIKPRLTIYALELSNLFVKLNSGDNIDIIRVNSGNIILSSKGLILSPGTDVWLKVRVAKDLNIGNIVEVKIYSEAGYVYKGMLTFK